MFATCRCTVCSLSTSDDAISRFDSPAATSRRTSASRRESGDAPFASTGTASSRKPASARWSSRWSSIQGKCASPLNATKRAFGSKRGELAAVADRHGAVAAAMHHERRHRHLREERARVGRQLELEERRRSARLRGVPQLLRDAVDLLAASVRDEEAGEHLRRESPVQARELDERSPRRVRDVLPRDVAREEHDLADEGGSRAREAHGRLARTRAREHDPGLSSGRLEHARQRPCLRLDRRRGRQLAIGEACADPVVAHDPMRAGEILEERACARLLPLLLEVRDPPRAEQEQRPFADRRVRDPAAVQLAETDVLLHHP